MNRLEEIIKKFIDEKHQMKREIAKIEAERARLAKIRNEKKAKQAYTVEVEAEIKELGRKISELGTQSQELQNKLDSKYIEIKRAINGEIDVLISKAMQEMREITENKEGIEERVQKQEDRNSKYEAQKQEFFAKFGRMPSLSERAQKENEIKEEECNKYRNELQLLNSKMEELQEEITSLAKNKREFRNGNFVELIKEKVEEVVEESIVLPFVEEVEETEQVEEIVETVESVEIVEENIEEENFEKIENIEEVENEIIENVEVIEEKEPEETFEEIIIEEFEPIEELNIEEFTSIEEINIEEFAKIDEIEVEEFEPIAELVVEEFKQPNQARIEELVEEIVEELEATVEENVEVVESIQEIEEKVEEIAENVQAIEENPEEIAENVQAIEETPEEIVEDVQAIEETPEEIVEDVQTIEENPEEIVEDVQTIEETPEEIVGNVQVIEEKVEEVETIQENNVEELEAVMENYVKKKEAAQEIKEQEVKINYGEKVTILNIIAKVQEREVVYVASLSNGATIKVYPNRQSEGKILEKERENINEIKEILLNYAISEYRTLDKKVIKKVDPVVCELLIRFAKKYNYDAQSLIYNYAMTFSRNEEIEADMMPQITYNLYFGEDTEITKREKDTLIRICKNARKNEKIEIIGYNTGLKRIKYIFRRTFNLNNNALPEGKY